MDFPSKPWTPTTCVMVVAFSFLFLPILIVGSLLALSILASVESASVFVSRFMPSFQCGNVCLGVQVEGGRVSVL